MNKIINKIKLNVTANTSHTLHCPLEYRSTYPQKGDIVVPSIFIKHHVIVASQHAVSRSARRVERGASSYCDLFSVRPVYRKNVSLHYVWFYRSIILQIPLKDWRNIL
jgi:hypothetical protein